MRTILIPVDFSAGSLMTARYALMLTGNQETLFHFFHIYPDQLMIPDSSFIDGMDSDAYLSTEIVIELKRQSEQNMDTFESEVRKLVDDSNINNIKTTGTVTGGDPEREIKDICQRIKPDIIIMGTRGEGKKGFLEGSMADKIMSAVDIPVIAVPDSVESAGLKNIMYATNFSETDYQHIIKLVEVFTSPDITFHVVHFELKGRPAEDLRMMEALQQSLRQDLPDKNIRFHLMDSDRKSESLQSFTTDNNIDLIAFIAHKTNIFQNLFSHQIHKRDFFKLELPMLALHE